MAAKKKSKIAKSWKPKAKKKAKSKKKYQIRLTEGSFGTDFSIDHRNGNKICYTMEDYKRFSTAKRILDNLLTAIKEGDYEIIEERIELS